MRWAPGEKNVPCAECRDIAQELNDAYASAPGEGSNARASSTDVERIQAASEALRRLIGGTEEDAEGADQLLDTYRYQSSQCWSLGSAKISPRILGALRKGDKHAARTGH